MCSFKGQFFFSDADALPGLMDFGWEVIFSAHAGGIKASNGLKQSLKRASAGAKSQLSAFTLETSSRYWRIGALHKRELVRLAPKFRQQSLISERCQPQQGMACTEGVS